MSEDDLGQILNYVNEQLKICKDSPARFKFSSFDLLVEQSQHDPRIWQITVSKQGTVAHIIEFEPTS